MPATATPAWRRCSKAGGVRKVVCSFPAPDRFRVFDGLYRAGKIELEVVPQGNLAERIRSRRCRHRRLLLPNGLRHTSGRATSETRAHRRPRLRAGISDPRRRRPDQGRTRATAGATWFTARRRATSDRSWRRRPSCTIAEVQRGGGDWARSTPKPIVTPRDLRAAHRAHRRVGAAGRDLKEERPWRQISPT